MPPTPPSTPPRPSQDLFDADIAMLPSITSPTPSSDPTFPSCLVSSLPFSLDVFDSTSSSSSSSASAAEEDAAAAEGAERLSPTSLGIQITPATTTTNTDGGNENEGNSNEGTSATTTTTIGVPNTHGVGHVLPAIAGVGDVKRISGSTMSRLLRGEFQGTEVGQIDQFVVIDCRYDYEYHGGHIEGALNINDRALLSKFFRARSREGRCDRLAVIFHCEFSQNRAPKSYKFWRALDRLRNTTNYPYLSFPELCVLDGGYKQFHSQFPQHCRRTPLTSIGNVVTTNLSHPLYVSMWDEHFQLECKARTAEHRRSWTTSKPVPADVLASPAPPSNAAAAAAAGAGHGSHRGQKRSARHSLRAIGCDEDDDTPSRTISMPVSRQHGSLFSSASPMRSDSMSTMIRFDGLNSRDSTPPKMMMMNSSETSPTTTTTTTTTNPLTNGLNTFTSSSSSMSLSPLPSFSLLSAQATPTTPTTATKSHHSFSHLLHDSDHDPMDTLLPVPFYMASCFSPEKQ